MLSSTVPFRPRNLHVLAIALAACGGTAEPAVFDASAARVAGATELCPMPSMNDLFEGLLPPKPDADLFPTDACVAARHDVIIVLGCPNLEDGTPSRCQRARADIAVALRDAGYADAFITTGAAVHTPYVEAETLRDLLVERGVDPDAVALEPQARHTDENLYYSSQVMAVRGWKSALVVSDQPGHFVFTGLCDSNCCVKLGRLTVVSLPPNGIVAGHYALYPWAEPVTDTECGHIAAPWRAMCLNLDRRNACQDRLRL